MGEYLRDFSRAWSTIRNIGETGDDAILTLMSMRGYTTRRMYDQLKAEGLTYVAPNSHGLIGLQQFSEDLGLFATTKDGSKYFLLSGRFILPIRDLTGNVIALVGWYPDTKKYITTSSKYFSKSHMFYGMENLGPRLEGPTFVVEGIFDRLALESLGYRTVATMGLNTSEEKRPLYKLMGKRILAIPDTDKEGRKVIPGDLWGLPVGHSYLAWKGNVEHPDGTKKPVKDIDDLTKYTDDEKLHELMGSAVAQVYARRITLRL